MRAKCAQVAIRFFRVIQNGFARINLDANCIEEIFVRNTQAKRAQTIGKSTC